SAVTTPVIVRNVTAQAAPEATADDSVTPFVIALSKTGNAYYFVWTGSEWSLTDAPDNGPALHTANWTNPEGIPATPYTDTQAFAPFALPYAVIYDYSEADGSDFGTPVAGWAPKPGQMEGNGYVVTGDGIIVAFQ